MMARSRTNPKHQSIPVNIRTGKTRDGKVTIYSWPNSTVQLWAWNLGPEMATRIELRGLASLPSRDQLEPALAMLAGFNEQKRRETGDLAGPGRKQHDEYADICKRYADSGYNLNVKRALKQEYLQKNNDDYADERINLVLKRCRKKGTKSN